ncbi:hypothetical protein [Janthinobacterium psychrotolerans]|uniref:Uncharacterized protein n=1 Tax=Janthinobacterium psychrotolerans TaxID=1747903 RepID=A0A1A7C269_9BURK|nr:hypothetical protein [Janthinobacterium psychrotolerans]OBV39832.1 hypothetical protein ASR47_101254 [Janthinobacterium psychrotolerans]
MLEPVNNRCINAACGKPLLLRVAYCPFCGTAQAAAPAAVAPPPVAPAVMPPPIPPQWRPMPPASVLAPPVAPQSDPAPAPPPIRDAPQKPAVFRSVPPPRAPVRLRTWLLAAAALVGIWFVNKPVDKPASVAEQVQAATALAQQCDLDGARSALAVLKSAKAPAAQIKRLQASITGAAASCDKRQKRAQAWEQVVLASAQAFDAGKPELAATRLAAYVKRWGEDADTIELDARIKVALASRELDKADACLAGADHRCMEKSLLAAERYKRPELAARTKALRAALSQLLERALLDGAAPP